MTDSLSVRRMLASVRIGDSLGDRFGTVLIITLLPVPLVSLLYAAHRMLTDTPTGAYSLVSGYLFYGCVNLLVVGLLYGLLTPNQRAAVFTFRWPSLNETAAAIGMFVAGLGVYQITAQLNAALGYQLQGLSYSLSNPTAVLAIVLGAVVLAPVTEEILYRGLVLGAFTSRGFGPVSATVLMTALFALIHLPNFGVAGTIFISAWGFLPAVLRLRYDNLSGAVVMHALNNLFAYVVVVAAGWA
ncbi:CPBP family intramembrane glutamic endopeptidase [Natribaculum luteum]|uniref:CPBP family intramembrane glutamic endopeptidase n=1 Tax=Natribaculum luteum TaxID=1586232 RepID=A0ABD5NV33_9EURY|nr:CPBP family intramembrane glutamic endopeptidase [Natribaculum luteum]